MTGTLSSTPPKSSSSPLSSSPPLSSAISRRASALGSSVPGGAVVAGIDRSLGYRPSGSLVLSVVRGRGALVRVDLPLPTRDDDADEQGRALAGLLARESFAEAVRPVVVAPAAATRDRADVLVRPVARVSEQLHRAGFGVLPAMLVADDSWAPAVGPSGWRPVPGGEATSTSLPTASVARQRAAWAAIAAAPVPEGAAVELLLDAAERPADRPVRDAEAVLIADAMGDRTVRDAVIDRILGGFPAWVPRHGLVGADRFSAGADDGPWPVEVLARIERARPVLRRAAALAPESLLPPVLTVLALLDLVLGRERSAHRVLGAALEHERDHVLAGLLARVTAADHLPIPSPGTV